MFRIKRTKPPAPDDLHGQVSTHFAARIEASGNVDAWTGDESAAVEVSEEQAKTVLAAYAKRPGAGQVTAVDSAPPPEVKPTQKPEKSARKGRSQETEE